MKLREGIYAFYDNYAISGFILTVADNIYTNRSKIIAGEKSASLSIEFGSNGHCPKFCVNGNRIQL